jgi:hypothetical protein
MRAVPHRLVLAGGRLLTVVLVAVGLAMGCGAASGGTLAASVTTARHCAASGLRPPKPGPSAASLVPAGPVVATLCEYAIGVGKVKAAGLVPSFVLRGPAAAGLAAVLDSAGPLTAAARACDRPARLLPFVQEIIFSYPAAPPRTAVVAQTDCDFAVVTADSRSGVLPSQAAGDLFGYTGLRSVSGGPLTPDLIGLTAPAAAVAAGRDHFTVSFDAVVTDPAARFGAVVFQVPPSGLADARPAAQVGLILAVHRAPTCAAGQLAASYLAGGAGTGNDFGTIVIGDTGVRPCTLAGPLLVTGLAADGAVVTASARFPVTEPAVLSPARQADALVGQLMLTAEYRDDPAAANGLCEPYWAVPATWRVVFPGGQVLTVANAAPGNPVKLVPSGGFVTCRGELGAAQHASVGVVP